MSIKVFNLFKDLIINSFKDTYLNLLKDFIINSFKDFKDTFLDYLNFIREQLNYYRKIFIIIIIIIISTSTLFMYI